MEPRHRDNNGSSKGHGAVRQPASDEPKAQREPMITASEAAAVMGCNPRTLKRMAERGEGPAMKMGSRWMFLPSLIDQWRRDKMLASLQGGKPVCVT